MAPLTSDEIVGTQQTEWFHEELIKQQDKGKANG
jgi:hypothetical protein